MTQIIFITIIAVLLAILVSRKGRPDLRMKLRRGKEKILRPAKDKIVGICSFALGQGAKKQERKEKILALLSERSSSAVGRTESSSGETKSAKATADEGGLSNSDIREALGVSRRSVVRYMNELEREGRVEQLGKIGRNVVYQLK